MRVVLSPIFALLIATTTVQATSDSLPPLPSAEVLQFIKSAEAVYIFPNRAPETPRRDDKHLRLLSGEARRELLLLLGNPRNWYYGMLTLVVPANQRTNIGMLFQRGSDELVLFFSDVAIEGTLHGTHMIGMLERRPEKTMEQWKQRYAQLELHAK